MLNRRAFLCGSIATALATPLGAGAQQAGKVYRVGVLSPGPSPPGPLEALREGLPESLSVSASNVSSRLTPAAKAAKSATARVPIVIVRLADPVGTGLVASLARPGNNITGMTAMAEELGVKRLDLIRELVPGPTRVAVMWNAGNPGHPPILRDMKSASETLQIQLHRVSVRGPEQFAPAVETVSHTRAGALLIFDDVVLTSHRRHIIELAARARLPVSAFFREFADTGALVRIRPIE